MKPRLLRLLACIGLAAMLSSCPETTVGPDFGLQAATLKAEYWNGIYEVAGDDDVFKVEVSDVAKGQLILTEVPADEKKDKHKPLLLTLRRASLEKDAEDLHFATLIEEGKKTENLPLYLVETKSKDEILLWGVNQKAVEAAIKAGTLKGSLKVPDKDGPHCHLDSDPANYAQLVQPQFWQWREPAALVRQKKPR